ncbi:MAG: hypothetical protein K0R12_1011 [Gammaproteobacteria bacterium]|jgi:hypothetical protein|nr:hypothetical protein [Gammaproteobacteria bacterium]
MPEEKEKSTSTAASSSSSSSSSSVPNAAVAVPLPPKVIGEELARVLLDEIGMLEPDEEDILPIGAAHKKEWIKALCKTIPTRDKLGFIERDDQPHAKGHLGESIWINPPKIDPDKTKPEEKKVKRKKRVKKQNKKKKKTSKEKGCSNGSFVFHTVKLCREDVPLLNTPILLPK